MKTKFIQSAILSFFLLCAVHSCFAQQFPFDGKLYFTRCSPGFTLSYIDGYTTGSPWVVDVCPISSGTFNGLGCNPVDGYIYYIGTGGFHRIDANCFDTLICPGFAYSDVACFDRFGRYWVRYNSQMKAYDVNTCLLVDSPAFSNGQVDIAFNPGDDRFYHATQNQVIAHDTGGVVVGTYTPGFNFPGTYGGMAIGQDGNLYGIPNSNTTTNLYMYNLHTFTPGGFIDSFPQGVCGSDMASFGYLTGLSVNFTASDTEFCRTEAGACVNFTNQSFNATSYQWLFPGATPASDTSANPMNICYLDTGTFSVTLIASDSSNTDTLTFSNYITVHPSITTPVFTQSGDTLFVQPGYASYQWYHDSLPISGATNYFYVASQSGNYNIIVSDINGCDVGAGILNVIASITNAADDIMPFEIFPNPSTSTFIIRNISLKENALLEILNHLGEIVYSVPLTGSKTQVIDSGLSAGIYFVRVSNEKKTIIQKLIVE